MPFSISEMFKPKPAEAVQSSVVATAASAESTAAPQPAGDAKLANAQPGVTAVQTAGTAPNGVIPDNVNTEGSPLDQFKDMWETDPNVKAPVEFKPESLDPTKLQEVMGKVDLTKVITQENLSLIEAGGEGATKALIESMNAVSQQTMMQSTLVANKMIEDSVTKAIESVTAKIPALLKEQNLSNSLKEQNPIYSNPAVKPVIDAVKSQLSVKFPDATTSDLTSMAQDFVKAMSTSLAPVIPVKPGDESTGEYSWEGFENLS